MADLGGGRGPGLEEEPPQTRTCDVRGPPAPHVLGSERLELPRSVKQQRDEPEMAEIHGVVQGRETGLGVAGHRIGTLAKEGSEEASMVAPHSSVHGRHT